MPDFVGPICYGTIDQTWTKSASLPDGGTRPDTPHHHQHHHMALWLRATVEMRLRTGSMRAGRGVWGRCVCVRSRSCWGTHARQDAGAHRSTRRPNVRLRRNTGPKATRHPAWECWRTGKLKSTESPCPPCPVVLSASTTLGWAAARLATHSVRNQASRFPPNPEITAPTVQPRSYML